LSARHSAVPTVQFCDILWSGCVSCLYKYTAGGLPLVDWQLRGAMPLWRTQM